MTSTRLQEFAEVNTMALPAGDVAIRCLPGAPIIDRFLVRWGGVTFSIHSPPFFYGYIASYTTEEAWFWSDYWQEKERMVDQELALGRTMRFESADELINYLDRNR